MTGFPTTETAGGTAQVTVTAYDAYGNVAAGYTGTVAVSSSDGHALLPADYTFTAGDAGQHTFAVTLKTAGTQSITVSDTLTPSLTDSETGISVLPAAARTLTVTGFPATETAGVSDQVTVTAYDAYGNVAAGYTGTVGLSSSDNHAGLPADYTFTVLDAGTHTFTVALETAGTQSITAQDVATPSITGTESGITIDAAAAHSLAITEFPTSDTAGVSHTVKVTAFDAFGNVATGYTGTVAFSSSDVHAGVPADYTFTAVDAGIHTFSITLDTAGNQSISAQDVAAGSIAGTEGGILVSPAAASVLVVSGYPSTTAGTAQSFTVTAQDPYGNTATGYTGTIRFESTDKQVSGGRGLPSDYTFTTGAAEDNGVHTFSATLLTAGTQSITAQDTASSTIAGTQAGISVSPAAAHQLVFAQQPSGTSAGAVISPAVTVLVEDAFGNVVTRDSSRHQPHARPRVVRGGLERGHRERIKWCSDVRRHED